MDYQIESNGMLSKEDGDIIILDNDNPRLIAQRIYIAIMEMGTKMTGILNTSIEESVSEIQQNIIDQLDGTDYIDTDVIRVEIKDTIDDSYAVKVYYDNEDLSYLLPTDLVFDKTSNVIKTVQHADVAELPHEYILYEAQQVVVVTEPQNEFILAANPDTSKPIIIREGLYPNVNKEVIEFKYRTRPGQRRYYLYQMLPANKKGFPVEARITNLEDIPENYISEETENDVTKLYNYDNIENWLTLDGNQYIEFTNMSEEQEIVLELTYSDAVFFTKDVRTETYESHMAIKSVFPMRTIIGDRIAVFSTSVDPGVYTLSYLAKRTKI